MGRGGEYRYKIRAVDELSRGLAHRCSSHDGIDPKNYPDGSFVHLSERPPFCVAANLWII